MAQMQKIKVTDDIEFAYHDSGAPSNKDDYITIVVIHGHAYHSGTFIPILEAGKSLGYRVILPNRRLYPGSTTYTKEEAEALEPTNPPEVVAKASLKQGVYLILFVNNVIKEHDLKKVILTGWSLGSGFLSTMVCSITAVEEDVKARLRQTIKTLVWWDPPATVHGIADPPNWGWVPLYDKALAPEDRGRIFAQWVNQYYPHPHLDKKDYHNLIIKMETPIKPGSFTDISFEELLTKVDLAAGDKGDHLLGGEDYQPAGKIILDLTWSNAELRKAWGTVPFTVIYGDQNPWPILWAVWQLEAGSQKSGLPIKFKGMPGVNHFGMHDNTKVVLDTLATCL
jgi:pimeloyl-ACP methyl ester carboxylesterase